MAILNSFVNDIFERIATEASSKLLCYGCAARVLIHAFSELAAYSKKSTISSREIQTSVRLILPGELAKHAISEGTKASCFFFVGYSFSDSFLSYSRSPSSPAQVPSKLADFFFLSWHFRLYFYILFYSGVQQCNISNLFSSTIITRRV
jgi:hypothetical protein